jgi:hypothetical protein
MGVCHPPGHTRETLFALADIWRPGCFTGPHLRNEGGRAKDGFFEIRTVSGGNPSGLQLAIATGRCCSSPFTHDDRCPAGGADRSRDVGLDDDDIVTPRPQVPERFRHVCCGTGDKAAPWEVCVN